MVLIGNSWEQTMNCGCQTKYFQGRIRGIHTNMSGLPIGSVHKVTLPNGEVLDDAIIIKNGLSFYSDATIDELAIFNSFRTIPKQDSSKPIEFSETGQDPIMVLGSHPSLHYRGNALKRHKIWVQSNYQDGLLKYGYTGWQHSISAATRSIESVPQINELMTWFNNGKFSQILAHHGLPPCDLPFNHAIFTRYEDESDYIGLHSDKEKDFEEDSYFLVVKFGCERIFELADKDDSSVFFSEKLPGGSLVIVRAKSSNEDKPSANSLMKHGVPVSKSKCGPSGSIVFRCIKTVVPWDEVKVGVVKAEKQKRKRLENKRKRAVKS